MADQPKPVVTKILEECQEFSQRIFEKYGEPSSLAITLTWNIGKQDFPVGTMLSRNNMNPRLVVEMLEQLEKQQTRLQTGLINMIERGLQQLEQPNGPSDGPKIVTG